MPFPAGANPQPPPSASRAERIGHLSSETRYALRAIHYLLTPDEFEELISQSPEYHIRSWIEEYWQSKDPVYTTRENEARIEHERRIAYAEERFGIRKWPFWDQRGEIIIRYGLPSSRQIIAPEVNPSGTSPPGELWYFRQFDLFVLFEDAFSNGEYTYYLERVKGPPGTRMNRIAVDIDQTSKNLGIIAAPGIAYESETDSYFERLRSLEDIIDSIPAAYSFNFEENQLPFVFSVDNFRGGEDVTRVEFNIEFTADLRWREQPPPANEYLATAVLWDTERAEIQRKEQRLTIPLAADSPDPGRLIPTQLVLTVPSGFYFAAVTLTELPSGRFGSYRKNIACYDFDHALAMSDILLASKIAPAVRNSLFNRGALEVVPHPMRRYRHPASIPMYFELYNLSTDERGIASYDVSYRIFSRTPRKVGFWGRLRGKKSSLDVTSQFTTSHPGSSDQVHITLGSENLWAGTFMLEIAITDLRSGQRIHRALSFTMIE